MTPPPTLLVIDDDVSLRTMLAELLRTQDYQVREAGDGKAGLEAASRESLDLILLDQRLPDTTGLALLPQLKSLQPEAALIVITAGGSIQDAVEAMRLGADNFVQKPIDPKGLFAIAAKGLEAASLRRRSQRFERLAQQAAAVLLGESPELKEALRLAESVAPRETTVLITGPTGSGKGLLARRIHQRSGRAKEPFVELNCAGLSRDLTESELFGHERGAFTGAVEKKLGLFEVADGGTLFLDEIGEMDAAVQAKLLKALEERRFRRVGGVSELRSDVRLIAATHRDLKAEVAAGRFRQDLFFRLNVFAIPLPSLADRPEDILPLAVFFLREFRETPDPGRALSPEAAARLLDYDWPGNVRELRNVMERAGILCPPGSPVLPEHLPPLEAAPAALGAAGGPGETPATLETAEKAFLEQALKNRKGSIRAAARDLGISRGTLYRKARKFGLTLTAPEPEKE